MAGDTSVTVVGNLVADPELRYTQSGVAVCNFRVASTPRHFDKTSNAWVDGEALFLGVTVWRDAASHAAESLSRGSRVVVSGALRARSYETAEGEKRTAFEVEAEEVGLSLRYAVARAERRPLAAVAPAASATA
jgi:single-strand DNA-binding protein